EQRDELHPLYIARDRAQPHADFPNCSATLRPRALRTGAVRPCSGCPVKSGFSTIEGHPSEGSCWEPFSFADTRAERKRYSRPTELEAQQQPLCPAVAEEDAAVNG